MGDCFAPLAKTLNNLSLRDFFVLKKIVAISLELRNIFGDFRGQLEYKPSSQIKTAETPQRGVSFFRRTLICTYV